MNVYLKRIYSEHKEKKEFIVRINTVAAVKHVTIIASGHGCLKKFGPIVIGCFFYALHGLSFILKYKDPLTPLKLFNYYLNLAGHE